MLGAPEFPGAKKLISLVSDGSSSNGSERSGDRGRRGGKEGPCELPSRVWGPLKGVIGLLVDIIGRFRVDMILRAIWLCL